MYSSYIKKKLEIFDRLSNKYSSATCQVLLSFNLPGKNWQDLLLD